MVLPAIWGRAHTYCRGNSLSVYYFFLKKSENSKTLKNPFNSCQRTPGGPGGSRWASLGPQVMERLRESGLTMERIAATPEDVLATQLRSRGWSGNA